MIEKIATKRDTSGNRYYLIIDHEKKVYTRNQRGWFNSYEYMETTKKERTKYINMLDAEGYKETEKCID